MRNSTEEGLAYAECDHSLTLTTVDEKGKLGMTFIFVNSCR
jgi:hypothetical protein